METQKEKEESHIAEQRVFNLIILDESGSMELIKREAVSGFNETVQTIKAAQKKFPSQRHFVSLVTFNGDKISTVYDVRPVEEITGLNESDFCPNCTTPLYDAMGMSLLSLEQKTRSGDVVLVTIITDGEENASCEFHGAGIKELVERLRSKHWVFTYIGTNQDVARVAKNLSINNSISFSYSQEGTKAMFAREKACRMNFFARLVDSEIPDDNDYFKS